MSQQEAAITARYLSLDLLAARLDAEWGDVLFPNDPRNGDTGFDPALSMAPSFFQYVAQLCEQLVQESGLGGLPYGDIGSGTGRSIYEWLRQARSPGEVVMVEPSTLLFEWATNLLTKPDTVEWVPTVDSKGGPEFRQPAALPQLSISPHWSLRLYNVRAEEIPRPQSHFGVVTCLNVVDRHPDPQRLIRCLTPLVQSSGLLIVSSPLDWDAAYTPSEQWVPDLRALFGSGWSEVATTDHPYDFRISKRKATRFIAQVLAMRKD